MRAMRAATTLLVLAMLAAGCGGATQTPDVCASATSPLREMADGLHGQEVTLVGELHGTREHPRAFLDLVCEAALRSEPPVLVGLELPPHAVDAARRALLAPESERLAVLLESDTWAQNPDGRASIARLELIRDLLSLEAAGEASVIGIDLRGRERHDFATQALEQVLAGRGGRGDMPVLLLTGSGHLGLGKGRGTLGQALVDEGMTTSLLTLHHTGGKAWNCVAASCGPRDLGINLACPSGIETLRPGLVVADACLGKATLSPLARDALGSTSGAPHRVLFVGNSLVYTGNLPAVLEALASKDGHPLEADMIATGGATLSDRVADGSVAGALATGQYRTLVLQERGGDYLCAFGPESCVQARAALASLARLARENGAIPVLLGTYQGDPASSEALAAAEAEAASLAGLAFVPVAPHLQAGLAAHANLAWFASDGMHPGPDLTLLQAMALHAHLFNRVPDAVDLAVVAPIHTYSAHFIPEVRRADDPSEDSEAAMSYNYRAEQLASVRALLRQP